jgi:hypothetical protein
MFVLSLVASTNVTSAAGAEHATFLNAPAAAGPPSAKAAAQFQLKVSLPEGRGLARALLDVGVKQEDAAAAAKVAAGHLGSGVGGCQALVSIERNPDGSYSLVRVQLATDAHRAVIEWRGTDLVLASDTPISKSPPVV